MYLCFKNVCGTERTRHPHLYLFLRNEKKKLAKHSQNELNGRYVIMLLETTSKRKRDSALSAEMEVNRK